MISKGLLLFKIQLMNQLVNKDKQKKHYIMYGVYGVLIVVLCIYSFGLAYGLSIMGLSNVIPSYAITITGLITLFFTAIKTNGVLFAFKDYDILMALPVTTSTVIASRFLTLYVLNLAFTALVMIPMGIPYIMSVRPGFLFYPVWLIGIIISPLIPTTIATVIGALIILFSSRFKYANAVTTIVTFLLIIAVLFVSMGSVFMGDFQNGQISVIQINSINDMVLTQIHKLYPLAILFSRSVVNNDLVSFLILILLSLGWYYIFVKLVSIKYKSMNTGLMTFHATADYKLKELKSETPLKALYRKEVYRFFSSTIYSTNMGVGAIMAVIFSAACFAVGPQKMEEMINIPGMADIFNKITPFLISAMLCMISTTSVSLSLEGKNLWIIKSLPIKAKTIFDSKILFNLTLQIPTAVVCSLLMAFRFTGSPVMLIMLFLTPIVYSLFSTVLGMYINILLPNYSWENEVTVIKQGMASMLGILGGLLNGAVPILILIVFKNGNAEIITIIFTAAEAVIAAMLYKVVSNARI